MIANLLLPFAVTATFLLLQQDLDALKQWSFTWRMLFNVDRYKVMEFTRCDKSHYNTIELLMGESTYKSRLSLVEEEKDLGITLSRNLKFSTHLKKQTNSATAVLGQLRRKFMYCTTETFKTLYCANVRMHH